ncbi:MAG: hypothetical protein NVS9B15_25360 [Acidobacteriaceae bacterium]
MPYVTEWLTASDPAQEEHVAQGLRVLIFAMELCAEEKTFAVIRNKANTSSFCTMETSQDVIGRPNRRRASTQAQEQSELDPLFCE